MSDDLEAATLAVLQESASLTARQAAIIERQMAVIEQQKPKVEIADAMIGARGGQHWWTIPEAAKEMAIDLGGGKRMGPNQLYAFLRNTGVLLKKKDRATGWPYHAPYMRHEDAGRVKLEQVATTQRDDDGRRKFMNRTIISPVGLAYFHNRILEAIESGVIDDLLA